MRAVLQLSHGVVEFIDRYKPAARTWPPGHLVTGNDHLGHGGSIRTKEDYGYFGEPDGNRAVLEDLHAVTTLTKQLYPGVPYFLLGHSMGSFYARQYLCEWGDELDGAIIMGTATSPKRWCSWPGPICRVLAVFHGWHYRSKLVARLSFLGYNKGLEGRTAHDWLNRDPVEVDRYRADERCTFIFTLNAYYSMFSGHPAAVRPGSSGSGAQGSAPAVPGRRCRPGGRTGRRCEAGGQEPAGCRCEEHRGQAVPQRPA